MTCRFPVAALLALLASTAGAQGTPTPDAGDQGVPQDLTELEARIREILDEKGVPGAAVALVDRDEVIWAAGVGLADVESGREADADTLFRVGSITKSFVSLAVLRFVEDGRVRLDQRVRDLAPDVAFENRWAESDPVLLVHLLEHTTGFDDLHLPEFAHNHAGDQPVSLTDTLAHHPHSRRSRWRPGLYSAYCNSGPRIAAAILEKIDGRPFGEILRDTVLGPLAMTTATLSKTDGPLLATGYEADGKTPGDYWHVPAALDVSAREMAALLRMLLNRGVVDGVRIWRESSIDRMERPTTTLAARAGLRAGYGLSNYVTQSDGFTWHGHGGSIGNFVSDYAYEKEHGVGFFVSVNAPSLKGRNAIRDLLRAYLTRGLSPPEKEPEVEVPAADLAEVVGYYRKFTPRQEMTRFLTGYGIAVVRELDGDLHLGSPLDPGRRLVALGGRRFRGEDEVMASRIFVPDTEDGDLFLGEGAWRRVSPVGVWSRWIATVLCPVLMVSSLLFALVWGPRMAIRRLRGAPPAFSPASLTLRLQPLLAVLVLVASFALFLFGDADPFTRLARPTAVSVGFAAGTLLYAVLVLVSAVRWWRARGEDVHRGVRVHALLVNLAHLVTVAALASWGFLGMRTWT